MQQQQVLAWDLLGWLVVDRPEFWLHSNKSCTASGQRKSKGCLIKVTTLYSMRYDVSTMHMQEERLWETLFLCFIRRGDQTEDRISLCESGKCLCSICVVWISGSWHPDTTELNNINWLCRLVNWKLKPPIVFSFSINLLLEIQKYQTPGYL
jgi:hypothetical protein